MIRVPIVPTSHSDVSPNSLVWRPSGVQQIFDTLGWGFLEGHHKAAMSLTMAWNAICEVHWQLYASALTWIADEKCPTHWNPDPDFSDTKPTKTFPFQKTVLSYWKSDLSMSELSRYTCTTNLNLLPLFRLSPSPSRSRITLWAREVVCQKRFSKLFVRIQHPSSWCIVVKLENINFFVFCCRTYHWQSTRTVIVKLL